MKMVGGTFSRHIWSLERKKEKGAHQGEFRLSLPLQRRGEGGGGKVMIKQPVGSLRRRRRRR